ncbi:MAG: hypothetical protein E6J90_53250 [Deltaproteobacteria bacterium]|nr:MAG: hypothetical protein E6J90_53250 [Deltaproteobacteria bacterium]
MTAPATLGRGLGRSLAVATVIGMVVFAVIQAFVIYFTKVGQECAPGVPEDPPSDIVEMCAIALVIATPCGVALSLALGRRLTTPTTARLDEVIESAKRMTGERLDERLPVSANGDPLDRLSSALNDVLARVQRGVAAQQQFAADASHELRTPLAVISASLEVARRKPRDPAHWEHVADGTLAEVQRMHVLVDKLLQLSRAGGAGLHQERTDLRQLASAAAERAAAIGNERGVKVELAPGRAVRAADADLRAVRTRPRDRPRRRHGPGPGARDLPAHRRRSRRRDRGWRSPGRRRALRGAAAGVAQRRPADADRWRRGRASRVSERPGQLASVVRSASEACLASDGGVAEISLCMVPGAPVLTPTRRTISSNAARRACRW